MVTTIQPLRLSTLPGKLYVSPQRHSQSIHGRLPFNRLLCDPLRVSLIRHGMMDKMRKRRGLEVVCYSAVFNTQNLQWISAASAAVLMFTKGTAINKSFLVPLFVLQAPPSVISWMQGEYGTWSAFLALLVRIFFFTPDDLELPLVTLLLVISAPFRAMSLRGKQEGVIISLLIAGYLAFQHFTRVGSLRKAFDVGSIVATIAIVCITTVLIVLLV